MRASLTLRLILMTTLLCFVGLAESVVILNPGFEVPNVVNQNPPWSTNSIPDWTISGGTAAGVFYPIPTYYGSVPQGNQVAWVQGPTVSQTLSATYSATGSYVLSWFVGRWQATPNYSVNLLANGVVVATYNGLGSAVPLHSFTGQSLTFTPTAGQVGQTIGVQFSGGAASQELNLDAFSLEHTPEPATFFAAGMGLVMLLTLKRKFAR